VPCLLVLALDKSTLQRNSLLHPPSVAHSLALAVNLAPQPTPEDVGGLPDGVG